MRPFDVKMTDAKSLQAHINHLWHYQSFRHKSFSTSHLTTGSQFRSLWPPNISPHKFNKSLFSGHLIGTLLCKTHGNSLYTGCYLYLCSLCGIITRPTWPKTSSFYSWNKSLQNTLTSSNSHNSCNWLTFIVSYRLYSPPSAHHR